MIAFFAVTATGCVVPCETAKGSETRSAAVRGLPSSLTTETGSSGSWADLATDRANGMFFSNSAWISSSSSGKLKPERQSSDSHSSSGMESETVSQVVISGVKPSVPWATWAWVSVSPLVVYSSAEMSGS